MDFNFEEKIYNSDLEIGDIVVTPDSVWFVIYTDGSEIEFMIYTHNGESLRFKNNCNLFFYKENCKLIHFDEKDE